MHGLSGTELLLELKFRHVHLPIIVVASDDDTETKRNAEKMKAIAFFRKPVDGAALLDTINWTLRSHNMDNSKPLKKNSVE